MKVIRLFTLTIAAVSLTCANPYQDNQEEIASVIKTGNQATQKLIKNLGGQLKKHLKAEGPVAAAKYCSENAFPLTHDVDKELGENVSIKRISLQERNPANAPVANEKAVLEALQALKDNNVVLPKHLVERVDADTYKFYKPLSINKPVCLKCHGDVKNEALAKHFKTMYPTDKAIGHRMGDLRGAVVVTVKK